MGLFEINSGPDRTPTAGGHAIIPAVNPRMIVAKRKSVLEALMKDLHTQESDIHFISHGDWNLFDFFNLALGYMQGPCQLWISTYAMLEFPLRQILLAQQQGEITEVHMVIDSRARVRSESSLALAKNIANRIALKACHAKVMVLLNKERSLCLVGSQNWTQNPRIETGFVSRQQCVAAFHIDWMEKVLNGRSAFE
jgi:hypothetical protein